jgi:hypothetical protein
MYSLNWLLKTRTRMMNSCDRVEGRLSGELDGIFAFGVDGRIETGSVGYRCVYIM